MKCSYQIAAVIFLVAIIGIPSVGQAGHCSYDPATHPVSSKARDTFLDFTLRRINPADANYGQCLSEGRRIWLEETLRNGYFWSNIVALGVLGCLFLVIVYQHKIQLRQEWSAAEIVTQLEQSLTQSRAQLAEATKKNSELRDALAAVKEPVFRSPSPPVESAEPAGSSTEKLRTTTTQAVTYPPRANSAKPANGSSARSATGNDQIGQMRLFTPDVDFVMKLNSLEQQLAQSREDNKQLRRRIAVGDRRLETEPNRNRQLGDA